MKGRERESFLYANYAKNSLFVCLFCCFAKMLIFKYEKKRRKKFAKTTKIKTEISYAYEQNGVSNKCMN